MDDYSATTSVLQTGQAGLPPVFCKFLTH